MYKEVRGRGRIVEAVRELGLMEDFDLRGAAEGTSEGEVERVLRPSGFHEFAGQREALENLEVFENSADRGPRGTLFSVLDKCTTPFGKRQLRRWLCAPLQQIDDIVERQDAVAALIASPDVGETLRKACHSPIRSERVITSRVRSYQQIVTSGSSLVTRPSRSCPTSSGCWRACTASQGATAPTRRRTTRT